MTVGCFLGINLCVIEKPINLIKSAQSFRVYYTYKSKLSLEIKPEY